MRTKPIALLLCAAMLLLAAGCGSPAGTAVSAPETAEAPAESAAPTAADMPVSVAASFPLLSAPFSDAETEEMANHNARRCALLLVNYYYCQCLYADGSRALVRYEIIDNRLHDRTRLVDNCPADFLCERGGRLYYLASDGRPESVGVDGALRRTELDAPCLSLQLRAETLYCLTAEGTLLALRGGASEALITGCSWAFVSESGIFCTAASDGRAHLFDPDARTDMTLTAEAAEAPTVVGTQLFYTVRGADGSRLCALDLTSGETRRLETPFSGAADFIRTDDGAWAVRLTGLGGAGGQTTIACAALFDASPAASVTDDGMLRRARGLDDPLRTDELLSPNGEALGFELVLPGGGSYPSLAADNPPETQN